MQHYALWRGVFWRIGWNGWLYAAPFLMYFGAHSRLYRSSLPLFRGLNPLALFASYFHLFEARRVVSWDWVALCSEWSDPMRSKQFSVFVLLGAPCFFCLKSSQVKVLGIEIVGVTVPLVRGWKGSTGEISRFEETEARARMKKGTVVKILRKRVCWGV